MVGGPLDDESLLEEEELEDEELELLDELLDDDELELGCLQHPSPSCTTSHLRLSAIHLAQPNVPVGTLVASPQPQSSPLPDVVDWHRSGQTTPSES